MYKLILVDDEEEVRQGILRKIDWNYYGFEVIGEAENGRAALDLIEDNPPDVVITDIKMPIVDGLELAETLREQYPLIKVVILSGFDDFKYAQQAIHFSIFEYILKPILPKEMDSLLQRLKLKIDEEIVQKESLFELRERYSNSIPILKDKFLTTLITSPIPMIDIEKEGKTLGVHFSGGAFVVGCISVDTESVSEVNNFEHHENLIKFAVLNIVEEILANHSLGEVFFHNDMLIVITKFEDSEVEIINRKAFLIFDEIRQSVEKYHRFTVTIGMGNVCKRITDINDSYKSAAAAMDYRVVVGSNRVIPIYDCEPFSVGGITFDESKEKALTVSIKFGSEEKILNVIDMLFEDIGEVRTSLKNYQVYLIEILATIVKISKNMQLEINDVLGLNENLFVEIFNFKTVEEVKSWITNICIKLMNQISTNRYDSSNQLIINAKKYIEQNYSDKEISIQKICDHLFISQSYLCMLFKKESGDTLLNYLIKVRMEVAKNLLVYSKLKTSEIAEKIGYSDPNYFSYFFKRNCGMSPREYKNRTIQETE